MPNYEYKCPRGHVTDRVISIRETPPKWIKCMVHLSTTHSPNCARFHACQRRAVRVIGVPHVVLMGEGFTGAGKDMHTR